MQRMTRRPLKNPHLGDGLHFDKVIASSERYRRPIGAASRSSEPGLKAWSYPDPYRFPAFLGSPAPVFATRRHLYRH